MCFSALHDISNLFLVIYMHAITNLFEMKRKHLRCVSLHCMIDLTCFSLCVYTQYLTSVQ